MQDLADQLMIGLLFHMGFELWMAITLFLCGGDKGLVMLIYKLSVISEIRTSEFHVSVFLLIIRLMMTSHLYMLTAPAVTSVNLYNIFQSQLTMCESQFLFFSFLVGWEKERNAYQYGHLVYFCQV